MAVTRLFVLMLLLLACEDMNVTLNQKKKIRKESENRGRADYRHQIVISFRRSRGFKDMLLECLLHKKLPALNLLHDDQKINSFRPRGGA